ncbi:hypothetical protein [Paraburkholderia adhaesiva]|uniref:hypothetical protein n=1 Tax=Paraburkholderia adhaesiva TaxID=2883244 RepID=UPI001F1B32F2|nr:hypothetical protein [Paraburkholderia adhaesiva]
MYSRIDLSAEISKVIAETTGRKHPDWITEAVMRMHKPPEGSDADFYRFGARAYVREAVAAQLRRVKLSADVVPDSQLVLEGFERLQKEYLVEEDGAKVSIPIEEMTDAQLMDKHAELRAMGAGCYLHADEIVRYLAWRHESDNSRASGSHPEN